MLWYCAAEDCRKELTGYKGTDYFKYNKNFYCAECYHNDFSFSSSSSKAQSSSLPSKAQSSSSSSQSAWHCVDWFPSVLDPAAGELEMKLLEGVSFRKHEMDGKARHH